MQCMSHHINSHCHYIQVYIWGRSPENAHVQMGFLGLFPFSAPYLPWVLLLFSMFIGNPIETDLLGIVVGHVYYFFEFVYPQVARVRGWRRQKLLVTPRALHWLCGTLTAGPGVGAANAGGVAEDLEVSLVQ